MAGGRPLKFTNDELKEKVEAYFKDCDPHLIQQKIYVYPKKKVVDSKTGKEKEIDDYEQEPHEKLIWNVTAQKPYTVTGLSVFLNISRQTLLDYAEREEFLDTIRYAKDKIEHFWESRLLDTNATGVIFCLKNNYGWKDKQEVDNTSSDGSMSPKEININVVKPGEK